MAAYYLLCSMDRKPVSWTYTRYIDSTCVLNMTYEQLNGAPINYLKSRNRFLCCMPSRNYCGNHARASTVTSTALEFDQIVGNKQM